MGTAVASYPWGNTPLDARHFALIDAKHVTQVHYGADVDMLVLRISLPRVMAQLTQLLGRDPHENINFNPGMAQGDASWDAWAPVGAALEALQRSPLPAFPRESMEALESMAIHTLLLTHPSNYLDALHQPRRGLAPRHVRMAEEFILANLHRPLPTAEIARHAQVSVRALFDAFRAFRQSTPSAYARQARLQGARQQLLQGSDCVADVARRWGFPHAGHFAALYRRQFGEPPAQALRARAKLH
jgi:AraC-like DNA-binding protein